MTLEIVFPEGAFGSNANPGSLPEALRELTRVLIERSGEENPGYGLGGEYGYGFDFENDTFLMHRYCWCEQDTCPWCCGCQCSEDAWDYFIDGKPVTADEHRAFYDELGNIPTFLPGRGAKINPDYRRESKRVAETKPRPDCDFCLRRGVFERFGLAELEGYPYLGAPNFWHKPSGIRIWWYKWIGRSMNVIGGSELAAIAAVAQSAKSLT